MARQFLNPAPVLHDVLGIDPAFNGSLTFYEVGTTDPKDTWSRFQQGDAYLNPNPIPLDSAARSSVQIWGDGDYTVVLKDADGETVWTRDWRPEQAGSDELPAKESGKFLTTDGENWLLDEVRQVPDPTGYSGRVLSNDGANAIWATVASLVSGLIPDPPEPDWSETANSLRLGDILIQWGSVTTSGTGGHRASGSITFPITYTSTPFVFTQVASYSSTPANATGTCSVTGQSNNGATINYDVNIDDNNGVWNISTAPTVHWFSVGVKNN